MKSRALDVLMVAGLGLLSAGSWMAWPPAGLIVPGAVITGLCIAAITRGRKQ